MESIVLLWQAPGELVASHFHLLLFVCWSGKEGGGGQGPGGGYNFSSHIYETRESWSLRTTKLDLYLLYEIVHTVLCRIDMKHHWGGGGGNMGSLLEAMKHDIFATWTFSFNNVT